LNTLINTLNDQKRKTYEKLKKKKE